ncbi:MAG: DUF1048 domain-containing protein [Sarcina sp.]
MNFLDKITGNDMTREFKSFECRVIKLPMEYQLAWEEIKKDIWQYSDFTGRNLMPIFDSILTMFEETALEGLSVQAVLGKNIKEFCFELMGENKPSTFRDKWRRKLNSNIEKKLGEIAKGAGDYEYKRYN